MVTWRKPSRFASAIADGVAPFRDFPVRLAPSAPLAAASLTRHRPSLKNLPRLERRPHRISSWAATPKAMVTTSAEGLRGPARVGTKCKAHRHGRARRPRLGHHRKGRREDVAEGLRQERAQRVLGIDCLVMGPHRRQDRKHPENQEHDPPAPRNRSVLPIQTPVARAWLGGRRLVSYRLNGYAGRAFRSRARLDGGTQIPPSRRSLPHPYGCGRSADGEAS